MEPQGIPVLGTTIELLSAEWGVPGETISVLKELVGFLESRRANLRASSQFFGDRHVGQAKQLALTYRVTKTGLVRTKSFAEKPDRFGVAAEYDHLGDFL